MATNIPPHHLGEIVDATIALIDNPSLTNDELCNYVNGPDFPTGATIFRYDERRNPITGQKEKIDAIREMYAHGRGRVVMQASVSFEETRQTRTAIVVTELPFQVNKASLAEKIADLVQQKKIEGIADIRDESDRDGMRLVIECKRDAAPRKVLNNLFKHTPLKLAYNMNMLALVDGQPQTLPLKGVLQHHIDWRREVVRRRTEFDLGKARDRAHILEGLKIALDNLDAVIRTIRESADVDTARSNLIERFALCEIQANAILEMQLRRLAALERKKIEDEYLATIKLIAELEDILANPARVMAIIKDELRELSAKYAGARLTRVEGDADRELTDEDLIADEDVVITVSTRGYIKRQPLATTAARSVAARASSARRRSKRTRSQHLLVAGTHDWVLFFTNRGRVFSSKVHAIPAPTERTSKGIPVINLEGVQLEPRRARARDRDDPELREGPQHGHGHAPGDHQEDADRAVRACPLDGHPRDHGRGRRRARVGRRLVGRRRRHPRLGDGQDRPLQRDAKCGRWAVTRPESSAFASPTRPTRSWAWALSSRATTSWS